MREYLLAIIGVAILGVMIEIILPKGSMSKYIKSFFGVFTILIIISPLTNLKSKNISFDDLFYNQTSTQIDEDYVQAINDQIIKEMENMVVKSCEKAGYMGIKCSIDNTLENNVIKIKKVSLNLKNLVISQNIVHINKYTEIVQAVMNVVSVDKEQIVFDE